LAFLTIPGFLMFLVTDFGGANTLSGDTFIVCIRSASPFCKRIKFRSMISNYMKNYISDFEILKRSCLHSLYNLNIKVLMLLLKV
jgi:hypothetical protein